MDLNTFFADLSGQTVDLSNSANLMPDPSSPAPYPGSVLDTGGSAQPAASTDWSAIAAGGVSSLLNLFTTTQALKTAAQYASPFLIGQILIG